MKNNWAVPIAIVGAGVAIALALWFAGRAAAPTAKTPGSTTGDLSKVPTVTADDHILGDPNAPIKIVEYTDIECPFCKQFHATMEQIMATYGKQGQVAWVVRNFPLAQLHPNAPKMAEAAECIAHTLGNAAYFSFLDSVFTVAPAGSFFPLTQLDATAQKVGITATAAFDQCVAKDTYKDVITKGFNDAVAAGGQGTPFSIVITADGQRAALTGAQPYSSIKSIIDAALPAQGAATQ